MSNENLKVGDLEPQEQQELCKKMQEAGCKGILANYNVKTAKAKIEEFEKSKQQNGTTQEAATNENNQENSEAQESTNETQEGTSETQTQEPQTDGIKEAEKNAQQTQEVVQENVENAQEVVQENANTEEKEAPEADGIEEVEEIKDEIAQAQKVSICHICRSAVIDNKCSGCGFSMR